MGFGAAGLLPSAKNINPQVFAKGVEKTNKNTKNPLEPSKNKKKSSEKNVTLICWNKGNGHFLHRKDEVEMLAEKYKPTVIGITEANMKHDDYEPALQIDGFHLERDNLGATGIRTRAAVFISEELLYKRRPDLEALNTPLIWLEILSDIKKPWLIGVGYRQWRTLDNKDNKTSGSIKCQMERFNGWNQSIAKANAEMKPIVLMGDINIDVTPWLFPDKELSDYQVSMKPILTMLKSIACEQELDLVKTLPTRHQGNNVPSILDLILTNIPAQLSVPTLVDSSSDHKVIIFTKTIPVKSKVTVIRKARSFKGYTRKKLLQELDMPKLNLLLHSTNLNYVADMLVNEINRVLDLVAPIKTIQMRNKYAAHLKPETKEMMTNRNLLKKKAIFSNSDLDWTCFKKARNNTLKAQRKDKIEWASKMLLKEGNKSKMLWQTAKRLSGDNSNKSISSLTINGITNNRSNDISNCLNNHFRNKIDKFLVNMPAPTEDILQKLTNTPTPRGEQLQLFSLTQVQLSVIMKDSKKNAASGSDTISGSVLNDLYPSIKRILLHLVNLSLCLGEYPKRFKVTKIIPLLKFGKDPLKPESYRPVSNLCSIGKIIEIAFFDQVRIFTNENKLINERQHGGRGGHSTTTCMLELMNSIHEGIKNKQKVAVLAIDMSAAFDLCEHKILVQQFRMKKMGFLAVKFLESFLKDRSHYCEVGSSRSETVKMGLNGVVQGGPSSGELFTLYVNDLPTQVNNCQEPINIDDSDGQEFVDDTEIIVKAASFEELTTKIEVEYKALSNFLTNHKMVVNPSKTQIMLINPKKDQVPTTINIDGNPIAHQKQMRILGMNITSDLKMDDHVWSGSQNIVKSISKKISLLRTLKPYIPTEALGKVGANLVNSIIHYGAPVWGQTTQKNIDIVQSYQTKAARVILQQGWQKGRKKTHRQDMLDSLGWPNTRQIVTSAILNVTKNAINQKSSAGLNKMFTINMPKNDRLGKGPRISQRVRGINIKDSFITKAPELFNQLPPILRNPLISTQKFKKDLKTYSKSQNLLPKH